MSCTICGAPAPTVAACYRIDTLSAPPRRYETGLAQCATCGFWWVTPPPDLAALEAAYRVLDAGHWAPQDSAADPRAYAYKRALVQRYVPSGQVLDVGCFHGELLLALGPDYRPHGVELCAAAAQVARQRGVVVEEAGVLTATTPGPFDAVFCMDTIEHVDDQQRVAARLAAWTAPEGVLVIETGDTASRPARAMGAAWAYIGLHEHVCAHSTRSLVALMAQHGMVPVHVERREHTHTPWPRDLRRAAAAGAFKTLQGLARAVPPLSASLARWTQRPAPWLGGADHVLAVFAHLDSRLARERPA